MEKSGLIVNFDYYMFEKVCCKLSEWKNSDLSVYNEYTTKKLLAINGDADMYDEMIKRRDAEEVNRFTPTKPVVKEVIEE